MLNKPDTKGFLFLKFCTKIQINIAARIRSGYIINSQSA